MTRIRKRFFIFGIALAIPLLFVVSCQHKLIYFPRAYPADYVEEWCHERPRSQQLGYQTSQGKQSAFLIMPKSGAKPDHLWLVCAGNGTLAGEWTEWMESGAPPDDAYLLLEYPGYGDCAGSSTPQSIRENIAKALPMAAERCSMSLDDLKVRGRFFGHSLGCAATLVGACDFSLPQGILIAPFTSTMAMADQMIGLPVGWLVVHRFDNRARISQLLDQPDKKIHIFHSDDDPVIPLAMGKELAGLNENQITLSVVPSGGHDALIHMKKLELHKIMHQMSLRK